MGDLVPHVNNPRKIKAAEKKKLWERIQKFGMIGIPVRDFDGNLLSGNRRCEAFVQNGLSDMMVDVRTAVRPLTDAEQKEIMVIENSHAGEWDFEKLQAEFSELVDLEGFGLKMEEITKQLDEAAQEAQETDTEPEMPIVKKFSEKYDSLTVVCDDAIDFNHLCEKLNLDRAKCYKSSKVGMQLVMDAKTLISILNK